MRDQGRPPVILSGPSVLLAVTADVPSDDAEAQQGPGGPIGPSETVYPGGQGPLPGLDSSSAMLTCAKTL